MEYRPPNSVELTDDEQQLYDQIKPYIHSQVPENEDWPEIAEAMESLALSLLQRDAIPEIRVRLFDASELAESGEKSPKEIFESNGVSRHEILRNVYFLKYLRHFIHGPNLPKPVIERLCTILNEDRGTSGMVLDQFKAHARESIRTYRLDRNEAATEFFRLGVEIGMELRLARSLRNAAKSTR